MRTRIPLYYISFSRLMQLLGSPEPVKMKAFFPLVTIQVSSSKVKQYVPSRYCLPTLSFKMCCVWFSSHDVTALKIQPRLMHQSLHSAMCSVLGLSYDPSLNWVQQLEDELLDLVLRMVCSPLSPSGNIRGNQIPCRESYKDCVIFCWVVQ